MDRPGTMQDFKGIKGLKLVHCNVRSLVKKIDQVRVMVEGSEIDVLTLSETWLKQYMASPLIDIEGYQTFRQDRRPGSGGGKRGGGLVMYVGTKYAESCESLDELNVSNENIEAQWLYIHRQNCRDVVVCNVYRPPKGDLKKAISYLDDGLKTLNLSKLDIFLLGDFNINYKNKKSPDYKRFDFFAQSNGLTQHINSTTRNNEKTKSLLDLAITNSKFISHAGTLEHYISDHQPIYIVHKKGRDERQSAKFSGRSYRNFNAADFEDKLRALDWGGFFDISDPGVAWEFIIQRITSVLDVICPIRTFHIKNYRPDWMTKELIEQIKDRDYFYKRAKTTGDTDAWNIAKYLRNITNSNIRQAKREFILQELELHDENPKKFWKVIKKVVPSNTSSQHHDILLKHEGSRVPKEQVAHFINEYFINVGNFEPPPSGNQSETQVDMGETQVDMGDDREADSEGPTLTYFSEVCEREVLRLVKDVNVSKSSGIDDVSSFILKEAFRVLVREVTHMFNLSVRTSSYPDAWKQALVIPIPKTGNLSKVQNYRPISLLPLPGKILEKLIHHRLSGYLEKENLLSVNQHGFRQGHSTMHAVAQLSNYIGKNLDNRTPTLVTYVDFKKAFDCVQHNLLLGKLQDLGLGAEVLGWVTSYLAGRRQRVYANNVYSTSQRVTQGVPQGSVLGPLFYIIYANEVAKVAKNCEVALYADDTVLYEANANFNESVAKMQDDIDSLGAWCGANGIMANTGKIKVMVFGSTTALGKLPQFNITLEDTPLQNVNMYKYLGITLDSQLTFNQHVTRTIGTVTAKLKQFQRMRSFLNTKAALMVYKNMLLPILEYGDIFLSAATCLNRKRVQVLQNKGLRCALGRDIETSVCDLHEEAKLLQLKYRREQHLLNFVYDQAQNQDMLKTRPALTIKTRSSKKKLLKIKRPNTEKFKKSLAYLGPKKWNRLPEGFHHTQDKHSYKLLVGAEIRGKADRVNKLKRVSCDISGING